MRTLNEQIQRLRDVLVDCYNTIKHKGGTIPEAGERNMTNLPDAVRSIPQEHTELVELTVTANGQYLPADHDADGFSKVTANVNTVGWNTSPLRSMQSAFEGYDGDWFSFEGIDTSNVTNMNKMMSNFWRYNRGNTGNGSMDLSPMNTKNVTDMCEMFAYSGYWLQQIILGGKFTTENVRNFQGMFRYSYVPYPLNIDTHNGTDFSCMLYSIKEFSPIVDISALSFENATNVSQILTYETRNTLIGDHTLEEVESGNCVLFRGLQVSIDIHWCLLDYRNMLACAKGVADLTGKTDATITLNNAQFNSFTEEQKYAIQSELSQKNWTLALV